VALTRSIIVSNYQFRFLSIFLKRSQPLHHHCNSRRDRHDGGGYETGHQSLYHALAAHRIRCGVRDHDQVSRSGHQDPLARCDKADPDAAFPKLWRITRYGDDPLDPTPWLYDAIRKQTENRPGEALTDLQRSIFLNDNRAVYRSRLALDQDRAARGASLGRIYDDLGFIQLASARRPGRSPSIPATALAHRFLSDIYRGQRRVEGARVSELLQAQMLQDISVNPVQPSLAETNLDIVTAGGPAEAGLNEFTPLFERDRVQLNATGQLGNDATLGGEAVASALVGRFSISAGAFHYEIDGWRENHDIKHNIYNLFAQAALTPELNAQVELRRRRSEIGDLALNFDPDVFFPNFRRETDRDLARVGLRYSPTPNSGWRFRTGYSASRPAGSGRAVRTASIAPVCISAAQWQLGRFRQAMEARAYGFGHSGNRRGLPAGAHKQHQTRRAELRKPVRRTKHSHPRIERAAGEHANPQPGGDGRLDPRHALT
jgi:hypothetical protein